MLKKTKKLIVTFYTSAEAMATEKACKEINLRGELISAPRTLTSDCGISYATSIDNKKQIKQLLDDNKIDYDKIVEIEV